MSKRIDKDVAAMLDDEGGVSACTEGHVQVFQIPKSQRFEVTMQGLPCSPYRNGVFSLSLFVPKEYPFSPPKLEFKTKIWHPNISYVNGFIGLDFLYAKWNPAWTLHRTLLGVFSLLNTPTMDGVILNTDAEDEYKLKDSGLFFSKAEEYTIFHAGKMKAAVRLVEMKAIASLAEMGFDYNKAKDALKRNAWDENAAVTELLAAASESSASIRLQSLPPVENSTESEAALEEEQSCSSSSWSLVERPNQQEGNATNSGQAGAVQDEHQTV